MLFRSNTITLPANTGTVITTGSSAVVSQAMLASGVASNGPTASAALTSGTVTITSSTWTKMALDYENWDTASCYNNTGSTVGSIPSYSFLPSVAGYYMVNASVDSGASTNAGQVVAGIFKNGSAWRYGNNVAVSGGSAYGSTVTGLVYLNGSTDYVSPYCYIGATTAKIASSYGTYFDVVLVRAA